MTTPLSNSALPAKPNTLFYNTVWLIGSFIFWQSSRPTILHRDRVPRTGPFILAANHIAPFDPALLIRHTPRTVEFFTMDQLLKGSMAWFFRGMLSIPLHRGRVDSTAVRQALASLQNGRVVGIFPEGRIRSTSQSLVSGNPFDPNLLRLARLANVLILPAVVWNTQPYLKWHHWLPLKSVRYGLIYGHPFQTTSDESHDLHHLSTTFTQLHTELTTAMASLAPH